MSTNNRWQKLAVKSEPRKARLKSQPNVLAGVGNGIADPAAQQGAERRRQGVALFRKFAETQEGARHG